jgi:hypothetical protein
VRAENCTRYTFELGGETHKYGDLRRYVCNMCGGGVGHTFPRVDGKTVDRVACLRCGSEDIIRESVYNRQVSDAIEVRYTEREMGMPLRDVKEEGRLKVLGRIRLGWQEPNASGRGQHAVASDHFVLTDVPALAEVFGEEPRSFNIRFPFSSFDRNIMAYHRVWAGGQKKGSGICICQGDGEKVISALPFTASVNDETGRLSVRRAAGDRMVSYGRAAVDFQWDEHLFKAGDVLSCPGRRHDLYTHCGACKPNILLNIRIRDERVASFGYWQIGTTSYNNYRHFLSVWDSLTDGGDIPIPMNKVPFVLSIEPGATLYQDQKSKMWASREAFFLQLTVDPRVAKLLEAFAERHFEAMLEGRALAMPRLMAPEVQAPEEPFPVELEEDLPFGEEPIPDEQAMPYDGDDIVDVEPEELSEPIAPSQVEQVPAPRGLNHKNFVRKALSLEGYKTEGDVRTAMYALTQETKWADSTEWSPRDMWAEIQTYAASG